MSRDLPWPLVTDPVTGELLAQAVQDNFDSLTQAGLDTGGIQSGLRVGTASGTWPGGSPRANDTPISHGLGGKPAAVVATVIQSPSGTWFPVVATPAAGYTTTQFSVTAVSSDGSSPTAGTVYQVVWLAIG